MDHAKSDILFRKEWSLYTEIDHIWKAYLTLEMVKKDKCPKYNGSSILLCTTHDTCSVQKFTMSGKIQCSHLL